MYTSRALMTMILRHCLVYVILEPPSHISPYFFSFFLKKGAFSKSNPERHA